MAAGSKDAASTVVLVDPETGEVIKRPRGRPTKEFMKQYAAAIAFAERRAEAKKAGLPIPQVKAKAK
jgi:Tfp pilus assembly protein PilN